jgi:clan AA aspartic protease (TIGR02281 family)
MRLRTRSIALSPWTRATAGPALFLAAALAAAGRVDVGGELSRLSAEHGFEVSGAAQLEDARGYADGGDLLRRLRVLLEGFDHIIVHGPDRRIARVIIMGRTNPTPPEPLVRETSAAGDAGADDGEIELETIREGNQHAVRVTLEGAGGRRVDRALVIDTGADAVVLPRSLIAPLGLERDALSEREVQTANGRAQALMGTLAAVWLSGREVAQVQVAFLDDDKIGGAGLLGMSVLGRFEMTIDDQQGRLRLKSRSGPDEPAAGGAEEDAPPQ